MQKTWDFAMISKLKNVGEQKVFKNHKLYLVHLGKKRRPVYKFLRKFTKFYEILRMLTTCTVAVADISFE